MHCAVFTQLGWGCPSPHYLLWKYSEQAGSSKWAPGPLAWQSNTSSGAVWAQSRGLSNTKSVFDKGITLAGASLHQEQIWCRAGVHQTL
eukprot:1139236-Pelagomonas_calceolata.AAC.3